METHTHLPQQSHKNFLLQFLLTHQIDALLWFSKENCSEINFYVHLHYPIPQGLPFNLILLYFLNKCARGLRDMKLNTFHRTEDWQNKHPSNSPWGRDCSKSSVVKYSLWSTSTELAISLIPTRTAGTKNEGTETWRRRQEGFLKRATGNESTSWQYCKSGMEGVY